MLFLGLDVGGTKTEMLGRSGSSESTFTMAGGGANLQRVGIQAASTVLAEMVAEAVRTHASEGGVYVCAGVAGAGRPAEQVALADRVQSLASELTSRDDLRVRIVHDAEIALEAAFHGESGIIVISGTGSVVFARTPDGRTERSGGWGYLLGDEGSGHVIGMRGLNAVCAAMDGGPQTSLVEEARDAMNIRSIADAIQQVYKEQVPAQHFARSVISAAKGVDEVAQRILREEAGKLADQVLWLTERRPDVEERIALLGGLAGAKLYQDLLVDAILERLPGWDVRRRSDAPCHGALRLAEKMAR